MSLKAVSDKIIISKLTAPKDDDIVMPEGLGTSNKQELGEVLSVGPGRQLGDGSRSVPTVSVGNIIYFNPFGQNVLNHEDKEYFILTEDDILAVVNKEN